MCTYLRNESLETNNVMSPGNEKREWTRLKLNKDIYYI